MWRDCSPIELSICTLEEHHTLVHEELHEFYFEVCLVCAVCKSSIPWTILALSNALAEFPLLLAGANNFDIYSFFSGEGRVLRSLKRYGSSTSPVWFSDVECTGTETSLLQCPHSDRESHTCHHHDDVFILCGECEMPL